MSAAVGLHPADVYDLVGIGLGPTHLALAIAFKEDRPNGRSLFLDQRDAFAWHPALLLPASRMQISFLKDLATFRNPQSSFSFISYLHAAGRLVAFTNLGVFTPSRLEWASYLAWAAERLENDGTVAWSARVTSIESVVPADGRGVALFKIVHRNPHTSVERTVYARNVSVAPGSTPLIPAPFAALENPRVTHTATYLTTLQNLRLDPATFSGRIAVIGGGQSSAEVFNDLLSRLPNAKVDMIYRASALVPADDSPFVNARAFDPAMTDEFHGLRDGERTARLREFRRANYACVAPELIESLYKLEYMQSVRGGRPQHRLIANTEVTAVEPSPDGASIRLTTASTLSTGPPPLSQAYDLVFLGTGYHRTAASISFLGDVAQHFPAVTRFLAGESAVLHVGRDYAVAPADEGDGAGSAKLFVLGFSEKTHGMSETLLSIGAVRAGEVVGALAAPFNAAAVGVAAARQPLDVARGRQAQHGTLTPDSDSSPERKPFA